MSIGPDRVWSWATTESEVDQRRQHAEQLVGQYISRVRYYTIDYRREELHPELIDSGPRFIDGDSEWDQPTWRYDGFDAMDFGIELETDTGAFFALTWDPPGYREGIGLQNVAMLGGGVQRDADVAIWDVSTRASNWRPLIGNRLTGLELHYLPWDDQESGFWCQHITFRSEGSSVEVVMGDADNGVLVPSADNVAVLQAGTPLPRWAAAER
ncbi:MAG: hypothetical protein QOF10_2298 [Kribbellaceae bacterium]|nr:hypothetical protein [Kribbellaceae bacterium]